MPEAGARHDPARHDPLTRLPGREAFCREVDARARADASNERVVMLLLAVNSFKDVNSAFGYVVGDAMLEQLAARTATAFSTAGRVARFGGDVFAILAPVPASDPEPAQGPARRLAAVLAEPFVVSGGTRVQLSGTIGAAVSGAPVASATELLRGAEIAMHRARSQDQAWALYDAGVDAPAADRLLHVAELRDGIATGQMEVHYQPVVDMRSGEVTSVEALVRWQHPGRGLVLPGEFIELAERGGLICELTELVVATVAAQSRAWASTGRPLPCAVNLSVKCLVDPTSSERLVAALTALSGAVTVEVTESVFADERAVAVLGRLAAAGVPCAIDDFGTGYSCLASLKELPVTTVKIDRAFLKDIDVDARSVAVVKAIIELASALGLDVIAEGIEAEATASRLLDAGVVRAQGFLFARPMPAAVLDTWLASRPAAGLAGGTDVDTVGGTDVDTVGSTDVDTVGGTDVDTVVETLRVLLDSTRTLLRVDSAEHAVGVLMRAVTDLGGTTAPAFQAPVHAIPLDISLGEADPLLPVAPPGSQARATLERLLPGLVEDARTAADKARRLARLSDQVDTDPLTGLGNRRSLSRVRALVDTDSVAILDLDHFKQVNDTQGHDGGDRLLVAFSRALRQHLRATDLVFRFGGEEFLVIMSATTPERGLVALGNLRHMWQAERPLPVTFSAGIAGVDEGDLSAAVLAADSALYAAKAGGRDRFELAVTALAEEPTAAHPVGA